MRRTWTSSAGSPWGSSWQDVAAEPLPVPPMPPDLKVVPPPASVPRENARFAGRWVGKWEEQLDHVLVVELEVQNDQVTEVIAVYAWGVSAELGVSTPGWSRVRGRTRTVRCVSSSRACRRRPCTPCSPTGPWWGAWRGDRVTSRARLSRTVREGPGA